MPLFLNIRRKYIVDKPIEETFIQFDAVISSSFNNSSFSTFGNFVSVNPAEFVFMIKGISLGRPMYAETASTKIFATLFKNGDMTKIEVLTKTNPAIHIWLFFLILIFIIKLLTWGSYMDIKSSSIYLVIALLTLVFDRFVKNILIAGFEKDLNLIYEKV